MAGKTGSWGFMPSSQSTASLQASANVVAMTDMPLPFNMPNWSYKTERGDFFSFNEIYGHNGPDQIIGGMLGDKLHGLGSHDTIWGLDGDDTIHGDGGNDELFGGNGDDVISGGEGFDTIVGGDGDDELIVYGASDRVYGEDGDDSFDLGYSLGKDTGNHHAYGGAGDDEFVIHKPGRATAWGGQGNDTFDVHGTGSVYGEDGFDVLISNRADDDYHRKMHILGGGADGDHFKVRAWQFSNKDVIILDFSAAEGDAFTLSGEGGFNYDTNKDGKLSAADNQVNVSHGNLTIADDNWTVSLLNVTEVDLTSWY
ncbi:MAG: hypothetical protein AcusKO_39730 [Acuticoccus sp.]